MITVRKEKEIDLRAVHEISEQAFGQPGEAGLVDKLRRHCRDILSLVPIPDNRVVDHILFSPVTVVGAKVSLQGMGLAPVAVMPKYQRRGIGAKLIREGIARFMKRD